MRALLGLLCFFCGAQTVTAKNAGEAARQARTAEYRAVLSEIAVARPRPEERLSHDLPDPLRDALDLWTGA